MWTSRDTLWRGRKFSRFVYASPSRLSSFFPMTESQTWERLEANAFYDPDILAKYEQRGTPIRVAESSSETIEVKLIPEREGQ